MKQKPGPVEEEDAGHDFQQMPSRVLEGGASCRKEWKAARRVDEGRSNWADMEKGTLQNPRQSNMGTLGGKDGAVRVFAHTTCGKSFFVFPRKLQ